MEFDQFGPRSDTERNLTVTHREAMALLSALELSPFEDEGLGQKLLNLIYSRQRHHPMRRARSAPDLTHRRRKVR